MSKSIWKTMAGVALILTLLTPSARAKTTTATSSGDWNDAIWNNGVPAANDTVIIDSGASVTLTTSPPALASITTYGTLTFTNWNTTITSTAFTISAGKVTHAPCRATLAGLISSNRVSIVCANLTIENGGEINVDAKGFAPMGPGTATTQSRGGGSYGGEGGISYPQYSWSPYGPIYGSVSAPEAPGSGGQGQSAPDTGTGPGGGAVRIDASGHVLVNGIITANGGMPPNNDRGGGSGGGIYITCGTISGVGTIRADGACGKYENGGPAGGGGGRVAIHYNSVSQATVTPAPSIVFSVAGGAPTYNLPRVGNTTHHYGKIGSLYFTDTQVLPTTMTTNFNGCIYNIDSWAPDSLTCNGIVTFDSPEMQLNVTNNLLFSLPNDYSNRPPINIKSLTTGGDVFLDNVNFVLTNTPLLSCGQNMTLTNSSTMTVWPGPMNVLGPDYGALVQVGGKLLTTSNCWIYPQSDPTNGWSALFQTRDLMVDPNSGINADGRGYRYWGTPGAGGQRGGGGYGGVGGRWYGPGGTTYGSSNAPVDPGGSGGSDQWTDPAKRQAGGGLIRIEADRTVQIDGLLTADGQPITPANGAGGAGGGIYILSKTFAGSGIVRARGADGNGGASGGGGRIAVYRLNHQWTGDLSWPSSVTNGITVSTNPLNFGQPGTLVWVQLKPTGTVIIVR